MWAGIKGHHSQVQELRGDILSNNLYNAYLFSGITGLGKTAVAREFFKAINCIKSLGDPCNSCSQCIKANSGTHPDLINVSPGDDKQIKMPDIRQVLRDIGFEPFEAKVRMVIIEPAEMLNISSSNALLKSLEEPPESTIFVLISHNPDLLQKTIISRCKVVRFYPGPGVKPRAGIEAGILDLLLDALDGRTKGIIQEFVKGTLGLLEGNDPFKVASMFMSSLKEPGVSVGLLLTIVESIVRDIMVLRARCEMVTNRELFDIDVRSFDSRKIEDVLLSINDLRRGIVVNVNMENAVMELFLKMSSMSAM